MSLGDTKLAAWVIRLPLEVDAEDRETILRVAVDVV